MVLREEDLVRWGTRIGREAVGPLFVGLRGPLGAGKSVLARAIARGAGVTGPIPSPTFNLLFRYDGDRGSSIVHLDLYRIENTDELWELGWDELGAEGEIVLVEWPEKATGRLPNDRWEIELTPPAKDPALREVVVTRFGDPHYLPGFPVSLEGEEVGTP